MRSAVLLCLAVGLFAAASAIDMAPLLAMESRTIIPGEYIVVLEEKTTEKEMAEHLQVVKRLMGGYPGETASASNIMAEYNIMSFHGYAARMSTRVRDLVRSMAAVKHVEANQIMTTQQSCTKETDATWGIVRTTIEEVYGAEKDYTYHPDDGEGVDAYIIDTGIYIQHEDFSGRAKWGDNFVDNSDSDGNGHGTHVAGTVMSDTFGLAKRATAIAVKVLNAAGSGSTSGVISGIQYVANQHRSSGRKSVANMSLGGGFSTTMNNAVNAAVSAGVHFALAAGNEAQSACNVSPASAGGSSGTSVTVGASDKADLFAYFSNYGTCVDLIGPGVNILSTWNAQGATNVISGTSMAAPHVAGVMAKYLSMGSYTTATLKAELIKMANADQIRGIFGSSPTPNLMVHNDCT